MNIDELTRRIVAPFLPDENLDELYHLQVKSLKSTGGKNPILDLALEYNKAALKYFTDTPSAQILLTFGGSNTAIKVKKLGTALGGKLELDLVDRNSASTMKPEQVIDLHDENYDKWLNKFYSQNNWVKNLVSTDN